MKTLYNLKILFYKIKTLIFDNRKPEKWECPNCHWDSTTDDSMENATLTYNYFTFLDWQAKANWTCPICGYEFETEESN